MSLIADSVPNMRANKPMIVTAAFFHTFQLYLPKPWSQNVTVSMRTGNKRPKMEKQKAPINPMNGPIVGTAIAMRTAMIARTVLST